MVGVKGKHKSTPDQRQSKPKILGVWQCSPKKLLLSSPLDWLQIKNILVNINDFLTYDVLMFSLPIFSVTKAS